MSNAFPDHFSRVAARYADFRPQYPAALFDYLGTLVPAAARVWDCAAGSGQATQDLARRYAQVVATDGSQDQLAAAPALANVEYRVALAEANGLPDSSVQLITVAQALHWFDRDRFFAEARRVLSPGGVIAVWAYGINQIEGEAIDTVVQRFYAETVGPFWPKERQLVEEGYRTIAFPFAELSPPPFHMEASWSLNQLLGYFGTWSATNRFIETTGSNPLEPLRAELAPLWGEAEGRRRVIWPLALRVGRTVR